MKVARLAILLLIPMPALAADNLNLAAGYGMQYGGFGGKVSYTQDDLRLSAGLGLLGHTSISGWVTGYSVGADYLITPKHTIGMTLGTTGASAFSGVSEEETEVYHGVGLHYSYYFRGADRASWHLGAGYKYGWPSSTHGGVFADSNSSFDILFGYQF